MKIKEIICVIECEDCGTSMVTNLDDIYMYTLDSEVNVNITCPSCNRLKFEQISYNEAFSLLLRGVKMEDLDSGYTVRRH